MSTAASLAGKGQLLVGGWVCMKSWMFLILYQENQPPAQFYSSNIVATLWVVFGFHSLNRILLSIIITVMTDHGILKY